MNNSLIYFTHLDFHFTFAFYMFNVCRTSSSSKCICVFVFHLFRSVSFSFFFCFLVHFPVKQYLSRNTKVSYPWYATVFQNVRRRVRILMNIKNSFTISFFVCIFREKFRYISECLKTLAKKKKITEYKLKMRCIYCIQKRTLWIWSDTRCTFLYLCSIHIHSSSSLIKPFVLLTMVVSVPVVFFSFFTLSTTDWQ